MKSIRPRGFIALFIFGAVVLTLLDSVHVHTHTLFYDHPVAYGSAWWVPLLMGCAAAFGGVAYAIGWKRFDGPDKLASWPAIGRAVLAAMLMYAASGLLPASTTSKLIVITIAAYVIWRDVDGTRAGLKLLFLGALLGPIAEAINPSFHYLDPDFARVPIWLPSLYACITPALGQLARRLL
jgi:hypothetical protein